MSLRLLSLTLIGFMALPVFGDRQPSSVTLKVNQRMTVAYGYHQMDEIVFIRKPNYYEVHFKDRNSIKKDRLIKRAFPKELAEKKMFELTYLVSRHKKRIEWSQPIPCASNFILSKDTSKSYCLDGLTSSEHHEFSNWISTMTRLFQY